MWRWGSARPWLLVLLVMVAGQVGAWRAVDAERHDRCVNSRRDIQSAILRVADELTDISAPEREKLQAVLADELPTDGC